MAQELQKLIDSCLATMDTLDSKVRDTVHRYFREVGEETFIVETWSLAKDALLVFGWSGGTVYAQRRIPLEVLVHSDEELSRNQRKLDLQDRPATSISQVNTELRKHFADLRLSYCNSGFHFHGTDLGPRGYQISRVGAPMRVNHLTLGEWVEAAYAVLPQSLQ